MLGSKGWLCARRARAGLPYEIGRFECFGSHRLFRGSVRRLLARTVNSFGSLVPHERLDPDGKSRLQRSQRAVERRTGPNSLEDVVSSGADRTRFSHHDGELSESQPLEDPFCATLDAQLRTVRPIKG
jgi:hypothetical protein